VEAAALGIVTVDGSRRVKIYLLKNIEVLDVVVCLEEDLGIGFGYFWCDWRWVRLKELIVGSAAEAFSKTAVAPLERIKILLQVAFSYMFKCKFASAFYMSDVDLAELAAYLMVGEFFFGRCDVGGVMRDIRGGSEDRIPSKDANLFERALEPFERALEPFERDRSIKMGDSKGQLKKLETKVSYLTTTLRELSEQLRLANLTKAFALTKWLERTKKKGVVEEDR
ncbi:hypothetical protein GIB67_018011, partial [Kingdonia uniflora]